MVSRQPTMLYLLCLAQQVDFQLYNTSSVSSTDPVYLVVLNAWQKEACMHAATSRMPFQLASDGDAACMPRLENK